MPIFASKFVSTTVNHPHLQTADASSIRVFLCAYDQYVAELQERACQLVGQNAVSTEAVKPVSLKFCVDAEWLESTFALGFINNVTAVEDLTGSEQRGHLMCKARESKKVLSLENLDRIVSQELRTNMRDTNPK